MIARMGLEFELGSDRSQHVVRAFRVQNPTTQELALHAVYIVDESGKIFYRKVASRRPRANELIDAIDAHHGTYPTNDSVVKKRSINVAFPTNNFQAILELSRVTALPSSITPEEFAAVRQEAATIHSDDALIAFRELMIASTNASEEDLLDTASWLARVTYFEPDAEAIRLGNQLRERLELVDKQESRLAQLTDETARDLALDDLQKARALLTRTRAVITQNAKDWRLRLLKTSIRSFREVAAAAYRDRK